MRVHNKIFKKKSEVCCSFKIRCVSDQALLFDCQESQFQSNGKIWTMFRVVWTVEKNCQPKHSLNLSQETTWYALFKPR